MKIQNDPKKKRAAKMLLLLVLVNFIFNSFYDGGPYHIEASPLICRENQWTGFYMIGTSFMKELKLLDRNELD